MGLIKAANAPAAAQVFSMRDIENQARSLLGRAQQRAESLLAEAQTEAEALKAQAKAEGFALGKQEGLTKGLEEGRKSGHQQALAEHRAKLGELVKSLADAMAQLDASRQALEAEALREVVELAIAIAQRVTKRQGLIDPAVLQENLAEAMKLVVDASDVRIAVHPDQKQTLESTLPLLQLRFPSLQHVALVDDATLSPGGCRVFSRQGQVDAELSNQLDRVVMELVPSPPAHEESTGP